MKPSRGLIAVAGVVLLVSVAQAQTKTDIVFTNNPKYDAGNNSSPRCLARTADQLMKVKVRNDLKWNIKNGNGSDRCPRDAFKDAQITLSFANGKAVSGLTPRKKSILSDRIEARAALRGRHKYRILFDGRVAEDPELDIGDQ